MQPHPTSYVYHNELMGPCLNLCTHASCLIDIRNNLQTPQKIRHLCYQFLPCHHHSSYPNKLKEKKKNSAHKYDQEHSSIFPSLKANWALTSHSKWMVLVEKIARLLRKKRRTIARTKKEKKKKQGEWMMSMNKDRYKCHIYYLYEYMCEYLQKENQKKEKNDYSLRCV